MAEGIGNYVFVRTIGAGNFAQVKLARHKHSGHEVAIKIIDKTQLDAKTLSKLHREVRIMKQLNHKHIVKLYEVLDSTRHLYLVMDYVSGGELYDYLIVNGRMREKEARHKFLQIFAAVKYCHDKHIIHRDLKAENLLLDENMHVKVADFGFSNNYNPNAVLETFCGSPPYAAPELFQGIAYVGPEVDVWSLGVILFMMTTSSLPFDGKNFAEMKQLVCRGRFVTPFFISSKLQRLLNRMINVDRASRASLDLFLDDPWLNEEGDIRLLVCPPTPTALVPSSSAAIDESIVQYLVQKYKLDYNEVVRSIRQEHYDDIYALYRFHLKERPLTRRPPHLTIPEPNLERAGEATPTILSPTHVSEEEESASPRRESNASSSSSSTRTVASVDEGDDDAVGTRRRSSGATRTMQTTVAVPLRVPTGVAVPPASPGSPVTPAARGNSEPVRRRQRSFTIGARVPVASTSPASQLAALKAGAPSAAAAAAAATSSSPASDGTAGVQMRQPSANNTGSMKRRSLIAQNSAILAPLPELLEELQIASTAAMAGPTPPGRRPLSLVVDAPVAASPAGEVPASPRSRGARRLISVTTSPAAPKAVPKRGRNSTDQFADDVVSVPSSPRESFDAGGAPAASLAARKEKPRTIRLPMSATNTTSRTPDAIMERLVISAGVFSLQITQHSPYLVQVSKKGLVDFEVEICYVPILRMHSLRLKRISGSADTYKAIAERYLKTLNL